MDSIHLFKMAIKRARGHDRSSLRIKVYHDDSKATCRREKGKKDKGTITKDGRERNKMFWAIRPG